tara:strand:- start:299 stop:496 length:198 start_codon:yes stop_codon:yes gene_type:complete
MKVGDLVKYIGHLANQLPLWQAGLVTGFDEDGDPIVLFLARDKDPDTAKGSAFFARDIEVISERG